MPSREQTCETTGRAGLRPLLRAEQREIPTLRRDNRGTIIETAPERVLTIQGALPLAADDPARRHLARFVHRLRRVGVVRPPSDDAQPSPTTASPQDAPPTGREIADTGSQEGRGSGRELEERSGL